MVYPSRLVATALAFGLFQTPAAALQAATGQTAPGNQVAKQEPAVRLRTDEVVVDAVVTDKKNKPVTDLTADDFEVYEDGVKQRIVSFRSESTGRVSATQGGPGEGVAGAKAAPAGPGKLVSMVFDAQTNRDTALLARRAATEYIRSEMGPDDFVAVFGIDQGLLVLAPFTQDRAALMGAIEAFTSRESKKYTAVAEEARRSLEGLVEPLSDAQKVAIAETMTVEDAIPPQVLVDPTSKDAVGGIDPGRVMRAAIQLAALKTLRAFDVYEKQFQAFRLVTALLAIINGQKLVRATRKTLLFFSEGLAVPSSAADQFLSVISAANKAGVTIYALDIAGLRVINPNEESMLERDAAAARRIRNPNPELVSAGASALGRMEDVARLNSVATLDELSEETGGYTIKNTNDLNEGLRRIVEGLSNYYIITYLSTNQNYDGKFRRITLKLKRPGNLQLRARQGYFGLRTLDDSPVMAHELPLLDRLNGPAAQSDFPLYAEALHFRGAGGSRQVAVYMEFPMSAMKFSSDEKAKSFSSRFALLVLVKNGAGEIVRKLGQEFALRGPLSQMDDVSKKPQIYSRLITLDPGKYTLEGAARDSITGKTSVVHNSFEVPEVSGISISMSSVVLSRGVNPLSDEQKKQTQHPLYLEGQAYFMPNVGQVFSAASDKNLLIYFNVYGAGDAAAKVSATLDFYKDGGLLAESVGTLPDPDATGRIAYVTSFGLEKFPAGRYDLRVTATSGSGRSSSAAHFEVRP